LAHFEDEDENDGVSDQDKDRDKGGEAVNLRLDLCLDLRRPTRISFSAGAKAAGWIGM